MTIRAPLYTRTERPRRPPVLLEGGRGSVLTRSQDVFFGAPGDGPTYDWPNPRGRAHPISLRFWSNSLQTTTLVPSSQAPFSLEDWPTPRARPYATSLRTWTDAVRLNLLGQDEFFSGPGGGGPSYDIANPERGRRPTLLRTWSVNLLESTLAIAAPTPFAQGDWPNPRGKTHAIALRTWTDPLKTNLLGKDQFFGAAGQPPPNRDQPNPRGPTASIALRFFANDLLQSTLAPVLPKPFLQNEWPVPYGKVSSISLKTWTEALKVNLLGKDQFYGPAGYPPQITDQPNPRLRVRTEMGWCFNGISPADYVTDPRTTLVPYVVGKTQDVAIMRLEAAYLTYAVLGSGGSVVSQSLAMGTEVPRGTSVTIVMGGPINARGNRRALPPYGAPDAS